MGGGGPRRTGPTLVALVIGAVALLGCSDDDPVAGHALLELGGDPGPEVPAGDLDVGDCVSEDLSDGSDEIEPVDCDDAHRYEVFAVVDIEGEDFPGAAEVEAQAFETCTGDPFATYVGLPYVESESDVAFLVPTASTWAEAEARTVLCLAVAGDGGPRSGSVRGVVR